MKAGAAILRRIRGLFSRRRSELAPIAEWFTVEFDASQVRLRVRPPGREPWLEAFRWADIERVCFRAAGPELSDGILVFTRLRPESFAIPAEARGGEAFWAELIRREHFDAELAITAASSLGGLFWWPSEPGAG